MPVGEYPWWNKPAIAGFLMVIYAGAVSGSFLLANDTIKNLMIGSVIGLATTVVNFYFGSSSGSQKKDETIAANLAPTPTVTTTKAETTAGNVTTTTAPADPAHPGGK